MAIVQKNQYLPGQNLTNLALNVDLHHLGIDKTNITVDYGTSPATVTIKMGSIIEVNGNLYTIEAADYVFQMSNATHNFITFTDNPLPAFGSAAARGTFQNDKHGFYQVGNLIRTLDWFIDQTNGIYGFDSHHRSQNLTKFKARPTNSSGTYYKVVFETLVYDNNNEFDVANKRFVASHGGYYLINSYILLSLIAGGFVNPGIFILLNGVAVEEARGTYILGSAYIATPGIAITSLLQLKTGDYIEIWGSSGVTNSSVSGSVSRLEIMQII